MTFPMEQKHPKKTGDKWSEEELEFGAVHGEVPHSQVYENVRETAEQKANQAETSDRNALSDESHDAEKKFLDISDAQSFSELFEAIDASPHIKEGFSGQFGKEGYKWRIRNLAEITGKEGYYTFDDLPFDEYGIRTKVQALLQDEEKKNELRAFNNAHTRTPENAETQLLTELAQQLEVDPQNDPDHKYSRLVDFARSHTRAAEHFLSILQSDNPAFARNRIDDWNNTHPVLTGEPERLATVSDTVLRLKISVYFDAHNVRYVAETLPAPGTGTEAASPESAPEPQHQQEKTAEAADEPQTQTNPEIVEPGGAPEVSDMEPLSADVADAPSSEEPATSDAKSSQGELRQAESDGRSEEKAINEIIDRMQEKHYNIPHGTREILGKIYKRDPDAVHQMVQIARSEEESQVRELVTAWNSVALALRRKHPKSETKVAQIPIDMHSFDMQINMVMYEDGNVRFEINPILSEGSDTEPLNAMGPTPTEVSGSESPDPGRAEDTPSADQGDTGGTPEKHTLETVVTTSSADKQQSDEAVERTESGLSENQLKVYGLLARKLGLSEGDDDALDAIGLFIETNTEAAAYLTRITMSKNMSEVYKMVGDWNREKWRVPDPSVPEEVDEFIFPFFDGENYHKIHAYVDDKDRVQFGVEQVPDEEVAQFETAGETAADLTEGQWGLLGELDALFEPKAAADATVEFGALVQSNTETAERLLEKLREMKACEDRACVKKIVAEWNRSHAEAIAGAVKVVPILNDLDVPVSMHISETGDVRLEIHRSGWWEKRAGRSAAAA